MMEKNSKREEQRIPLDLGEWIAPERITQWVFEEVAALDWGNPTLQQYLQKHPDFRPKELLCLLIFAYATSLLESDEIVDVLRRPESQLRNFWKGPEPNAKDIGKFRKENRALLKWGLVQILKRALEQKLQLGEIRLPAGLRQTLVVSATERLDLARHMDRAAQGA
jgi:hypothetical protein